MNTNLTFSGSQSEFCDCSEGRSILSPAAYFVDLMETEAKYLSYYPTKDLLGYFPFYNNTKAIAGDKSIIWQVEGNTAFTENYRGQENAAFDFDKKTYLESTQEVELGDTFTVALWVKLKEYATAESTLFVLMMLDPGGPGYCSLGITQGVLTWDLYNTKLNPVTTKIPLQKWTHVAATIDRNSDSTANVNLYINGQPVSINPQVSTLWQPEKAKIRIGHGQGDYHLNGAMSDLCIYDRILTPEEVSGLYKPSSILTQRRPDLLNVALTDENTYTNVSKLEIVNSILETHAKVDLLGKQKLVGYFPFHGNTFAIAGNNSITWTVKGNTFYTENHRGEENAAFYFDEKTHLESEQEVELKSTFTVAFWVNLAEYADRNSTLFQLMLEDASPGYCSLTITPEGMLNWYLPEHSLTKTTTTISLNKWIHVTATMEKIADDKANVHLYINGELINENSQLSTSWEPKKAKIEIGRKGVYNFNGAMSDFLIYDKALTSKEVKALRFDVYEALALQSNYPFNLPFDLPLTRIQTYLAKQKTSVAKIATAINRLVNDMDLGHEVKADYGKIGLYLSQATWDLVSTPVVSDPSTLASMAAYYGFRDITDEQQLVKKLTSVDTFLAQTGLSYGQLLELTNQDLSEAEIRSSEHFQNKFFINIDSPEAVVIEKAQDNSQTEELKNLNLNNLDRINRFVRLAEAIDFSFTELDWALHTIGKLVNAKDKGNPVITNDVLPYLAWMKELKDEKGFSIEQSAALIGRIKDFGNKEGKNTDLLGKIYKRVGIPQINNKGTQVYADDKGHYGLMWEVGSSHGLDRQIQNCLTAALKVDHTTLLIIAHQMLLAKSPNTMPVIFLLLKEVNAMAGVLFLRKFLKQLTLSLENLSILYRFSKLPELLGLSVKESFVALSLLGDLTEDSAPLQSLKDITGMQGEKVFNILGELTQLANWLKASGLSVYQLAYLLTGDSQNAAIQNKQLGTDAVKNFLSDLRDHIEPTLFTKERFQDAIHSIGLTNEQRDTAWTNMSNALIDDSAQPQYFWADWGLLTSAAQKPSLLHFFIKYDHKQWSVESDSTTDNKRSIEIKTTGEDNVTLIVDLSNHTVEVATTDPNKTTQVTDTNQVIQVIDPSKHSFNGIIIAQTPSADTIKTTLHKDSSIPSATLESLTQTLAKALTHYYQLQQKSLSHQLASLFSVPEKMVAWLERWSAMAMGKIIADEVIKDEVTFFATGIATREPAAVILLQTFLAAIPNPGTKKPMRSDLDSLKEATDNLHNLEQYAALITSFALSPAEAASMVNNPAIYGFSYPTKRTKTKRPIFNLANLQTIFRYKQLVQQFQDRENKFLGYFSWLINNSTTATIEEATERIIAITAWNKTEMKALMKQDNDKESLFAQWLPTDTTSLINKWFPTVNFIYFLNQLFSISARLELDIHNLSNLISLVDSTPSGTDIEQYNHREQIANLLSSGLQKKDKDQPQTLTDLTNQINGAKRDALVPYVIHGLNQQDHTLKLRNPRDLYGYLLIDVEVAGIVPTSYVKDAISTVQLYLYRSLNQLEPGVKVDPELHKIWPWMNHYRVWQDNREVFLYPENYIEPELRKEKTPEYKTLENALQQGDLTNHVVVDAAFQAYMNSFVHIAGLDIIGSYAREYDITQEPEAALTDHRDLFLVGRTVKDPKGYYYRLASVKKPKDTASASFNWQPWLAIDTHMKPAGAVSPIFAFGKWFVFWVELRQSSSTREKDSTKSTKGYEGTIYYSYLDFNQKWMAPQQLAEPVALPKSIDSMEKAKSNNYGQVSVKFLDDNNKGNIGIVYYNEMFRLAEDFTATNNSFPIGGIDANDKHLVVMNLMCVFSNNAIISSETQLVFYQNTPKGLSPNTPQFINIQWSERIDVGVGLRTGDFKDLSKLPPDHRASSNVGIVLQDDVAIAYQNKEYRIFQNTNGSWSEITQGNQIVQNQEIITKVAFDDSNIVFLTNGIHYLFYTLDEETITYHTVSKNEGVRDFVLNNEHLYSLEVHDQNTHTDYFYSYELSDLASVKKHGPFYADDPNYPPYDFVDVQNLKAKGKYMYAVTTQDCYGLDFFDKPNNNNPEVKGIKWKPHMEFSALGVSGGVDSRAVLKDNYLLIYIIDDYKKKDLQALYYKIDDDGNLTSGTKINIPYEPHLGFPDVTEAKEGASINGCAMATDIDSAYLIVSMDNHSQVRSLKRIQEFYVDAPMPATNNVVGGKTATNWTIEPQNGAYFLEEGSNAKHVRLTSSQAILTSLSTALFEGVSKLLSIKSQRTPEKTYYYKYHKEQYQAHGLDFFGANGEYYWEIFFHAPFLIAKSLQKQQQFKHAQKWFKYIFNPTVSAANWDLLPHEEPNDKYWRFLGLRTAYNLPLQTELNERWSKEVENDFDKNSAQLEKYHDDPFDPHAIARLRPIAYQKAIKMSYIDNLIQWGDNLFREYSIESILEATMLYVEAYDMLGNKPTDSGPCDLPDPMNLAQIRTYSKQKTNTKTLQGIPEFLIKIEQSQGPTTISSTQPTPHNLIPGDYFCLPENDKYIGYWTTIQKRLYNIRHELNIDGVQENLALFQPPINPLALVEAFAAGESIGEALSTLQVAFPYYRFDVLIEKAREATQLTIQLGQSVLAALEKNDAEALAILNSNNQQNILSLTSIAKQEQIDQAGQSIEALQASLQNATDRLNHYTQLINKGLLGGEIAQLTLESYALTLQTESQIIKEVAVPIYDIPTIFGFSDGGAHPGDSVQASSSILEGTANTLSMGSGLAGTQAGFARRTEDWTLQQTIAQDDIEQIKQQILAAQTQQRMAQQDLVILQKNLDQEQKVETFLKSKFTNQQLYQWLIGKSSALYFQAYQLAYELCVTVQQAWQFELGASQNFIQPGYWNNLHHGLLAGEGLQLSLQRMENAFMRQNKRKFEIEKIISLKTNYPDVFQDLVEHGECTFSFKKNDFDADYQNHTFRQIKTIALSFPAVLGPYQTIHATLTQTSNTLTWPDGSQHKDFRTNQQVALSQGLNDSGLFELNFNDARYLPFEGTGAVSTWKLEIPTATNPGLISTDNKLDKLTDVIITLRYTALPN
ncbi:MAG: LamG-like jellyroll fold domain-containing protein [Crocosphaera sp.]